MTSVFGMLSLLLLGLGSTGGAPRDLVSLMDSADYFLPRQIEIKPDNLLRLAVKKPEDARSELVQLLAIRWLGENGDQLGIQKEAVQKALRQMTAGPDDFAKDYAAAALAKLEGKSSVGLQV